jgi:hypothetical protein
MAIDLLLPIAISPARQTIEGYINTQILSFWYVYKYEESIDLDLAPMQKYYYR